MSYLASDPSFSLLRINILFILIWFFFMDANLWPYRVFLAAQNVVKSRFEVANISFQFERVDSAAIQNVFLNTTAKYIHSS